MANRCQAKAQSGILRRVKQILYALNQRRIRHTECFVLHRQLHRAATLPGRIHLGRCHTGYRLRLGNIIRCVAAKALLTQPVQISGPQTFGGFLILSRLDNIHQLGFVYLRHIFQRNQPPQRAVGGTACRFTAQQIPALALHLLHRPAKLTNAKARPVGRRTVNLCQTQRISRREGYKTSLVCPQNQIFPSGGVGKALVQYLIQRCIQPAQLQGSRCQRIPDNRAFTLIHLAVHLGQHIRHNFLIGHLLKHQTVTSAVWLNSP